MKRYAVLTVDNKVDNIIVAKTLDEAEYLTTSHCVLITESTKEAHLGLSYANGEFEQPPAPAETTTPDPNANKPAGEV